MGREGKMERLIGDIEYEIKDGKLHLSFPLTGAGSPSASGKTTVYASTRGNIEVPGTGGGYLGLNFYRRR